jgi:hypothetical protein
VGRLFVAELVRARKIRPENEALPGLPGAAELTRAFRPVMPGLSEEQLRAGVERVIRHNDSGRFQRAWDSLYAMGRRASRGRRALAA